ncbi:hypothetical protein AX774_g2995, partial [Zancudomyces culisetae]
WEDASDVHAPEIVADFHNQYPNKPVSGPDSRGIPRRLDYSRTDQADLSGEYPKANQEARLSRLPDKFREVIPDTQSGDGTSRNEEAVHEAPQPRASLPARHRGRSGEGASAGHSAGARQAQIAATDSTQESGHERGKILGRPGCHHTDGKGKPGMVGQPYQVLERQIILAGDSGSRGIYRCLGPWMGGCHRQQIMVRSLEQSGFQVPYQRERVEGGGDCSQAQRGQGEVGSHLRGQHDYPGLRSEIWRNALCEPPGYCRTCLELLPEVWDSTSDVIYPIRNQPCGCSFQIESSERMELEPISFSRIGEAMGATQHRPLRFIQQQPTSGIR